MPKKHHWVMYAGLGIVGFLAFRRYIWPLIAPPSQNRVQYISNPPRQISTVTGDANEYDPSQRWDNSGLSAPFNVDPPTVADGFQNPAVVATVKRPTVVSISGAHTQRGGPRFPPSPQQ